LPSGPPRRRPSVASGRVYLSAREVVADARSASGELPPPHTTLYLFALSTVSAARPPGRASAHSRPQHANRASIDGCSPHAAAGSVACWPKRGFAPTGACLPASAARERPRTKVRTGHRRSATTQREGGGSFLLAPPKHDQSPSFGSGLEE
jgi:hypothetical protein